MKIQSYLIIFCTAQASFARWEPRHGKFQFRHPWDQYLKIGTLSRQCAHRMEALNGHLNFDVQVYIMKLINVCVL